MRDAAVSSSMVTGAHHWDIEDSSTGVAGAGVMPPPRLSFGGKTPYAAPELPRAGAVQQVGPSTRDLAAAGEILADISRY